MSPADADTGSEDKFANLKLVRNLFAITLLYLSGREGGTYMYPPPKPYYPTTTTRYALFDGAVPNETVTVFASVLTTSASALS